MTIKYDGGSETLSDWVWDGVCIWYEADTYVPDLRRESLSESSRFYFKKSCQSVRHWYDRMGAKCCLVDLATTVYIRIIENYIHVNPMIVECEGFSQNGNVLHKSASEVSSTVTLTFSRLPATIMLWCRWRQR